MHIVIRLPVHGAGRTGTAIGFSQRGVFRQQFNGVGGCGDRRGAGGVCADINIGGAAGGGHAGDTEIIVNMERIRVVDVQR